MNMVEMVDVSTAIPWACHRKAHIHTGVADPRGQATGVWARDPVSALVYTTCQSAVGKERSADWEQELDRSTVGHQG